MIGKGFVCEVEINLHLLSSIGNHECPGQMVYLSIELFDTVHKTKPQPSYYPMIFNEVFRFKKIFYSATNESEVFDILEDLPVVIELRRLDPCFYNGLLLSYFDGNAKEFLFSKYPRNPCSANGIEIFLERTVDFQGTSPRLRYSTFADLKKEFQSFSAMDSKYLSNSRSDDGYYSPSHSVSFDKINYDAPKRMSRSKSKYPGESIENLTSSKPCYTRQTVSSALRSRSPSPQMNKSMDYKEDIGPSAMEIGNEDSDKPPFVVRKVPDNLIARSPKLHDNLRGRSRKRKPKLRRSSSRNRQQNPESSIPMSNRFRSSSLSRKSDLNDNIENYKPGSILSKLRGSYEFPHHCYRYNSHSFCHSSPYDCYYGNNTTRCSCLSPRHYYCYSNCSHWGI